MLFTANSFRKNTQIFKFFTENSFKKPQQICQFYHCFKQLKNKQRYCQSLFFVVVFLGKYSMQFTLFYYQHKQKDVHLERISHIVIITLLPFFIEMLQCDWLSSGHMIIKEMFYIPIKLKPKLAHASMTTSDVNNQWRSNFQQQII